MFDRSSDQFRQRHARKRLFGRLVLQRHGGAHGCHRPRGTKRRVNEASAFTTASNVVELLAPIHSDIFFQEKLMLNGVDIKIRMTRGKDEFCLMRDDAIL